MYAATSKLVDTCSRRADVITLTSQDSNTSSGKVLEYILHRVVSSEYQLQYSIALLHAMLKKRSSKLHRFAP